MLFGVWVEALVSLRVGDELVKLLGLLKTSCVDVVGTFC